MHENYINACGSCITQHILNVTIANSGLHWRMRFAQIAALEMNALRNVTVLEAEIPEDVAKELCKKPVSYTLLGLPVRIDNSLPPSRISLYLGEKEVNRIEALSIPFGFPLE